MDIKKTIKEFLTFVLIEEVALEDLSILLSALDKLAYSINFINYKFDETEYPDGPEDNYKIFRQKVEKRFPTLGFYNIPMDVSDKLKKSELIVGDAIDDITDIIGDQ